MRDIYTYIARDNREAATRVLDVIRAKFQMLARQPLIGDACEELAEGLRNVPSGSSVIYYLPVSDGVRIVRVLHGARDVRPIFGE